VAVKAGFLGYGQGLWIPLGFLDHRRVGVIAPEGDQQKTTKEDQARQEEIADDFQDFFSDYPLSVLSDLPQQA